MFVKDIFKSYLVKGELLAPSATAPAPSTTSCGADTLSKVVGGEIPVCAPGVILWLRLVLLSICLDRKTKHIS